MSQDAMFVLDAVRSGEALVRAQRIKKKVQDDNAEGWYNPGSVDGVSLELSEKSLKEGLSKIKKIYGIKLASYLCGLDTETPFRKWEKGTESPNFYQARQARDVIEVTEILLGKMSPKEAKEWMISPCAYLLHWLPMDELRADPKLVRSAALSVYV